jgi:hypothetical protein
MLDVVACLRVARATRLRGAPRQQAAPRDQDVQMGSNVGLASVGNHGPAIDHQIMAVDEPARRAREEHGRSANLLDTAHPAKRSHLHAPDHELCILRQVGNQFGSDQPGRYRIGANALRPPLYRQIAGQLRDASLCQRIGPSPCARQYAAAPDLLARLGCGD